MRAKLTHRLPRLGATVLAGATTLAVLGACSEDTLGPIELEHVSTGSDGFHIANRVRDVDLLFVIDNSSSMAEEQAILASNFGAFVEVLESESMQINYRIGITTTDNGNPACDASETTPESGALVMSSCKQRLDDFVLDEDQQIDARDIACNDICTLDADALEILPTTTSFDDAPAVRPWLERIDGRKNIPASTSTAEAFECFGPQGINGCGFESPLESMYLALLRAQSVGDPAYGFLRDDAILSIIFVTDEADCSYAEPFSTVFEAGGDTGFWSDPDADAPSSAVCWNAGVSCEGDPGHYDACEPVNKDIEGNEGVDDAEAVLRPMSRYLGLLEGLEQQQRVFEPNREIIVGLIGGVGINGAPFYHDIGDNDPVFQDRFGIGPGCVAANPDAPDEPIQAVPPVRLRALVDEYTPGNMFSICAPDYTPVLGSLARTLKDQIVPFCYDYCAEDTDPSTLALEPACVVEERPREGGDALTLRECARDTEGYLLQDNDYVMPSEDVDTCYAMMTDHYGREDTATTTDDMSDFCLDSNHNLEFKLARRPGTPRTGSVMATCLLADEPALSCPGIGD